MKTKNDNAQRFYYVLDQDGKIPEGGAGLTLSQAKGMVTGGGMSSARDMRTGITVAGGGIVGRATGKTKRRHPERYNN